ncbi:unnamed protein product [Rotaria sordida]|uniref:Uncharacterized protein n=1 Tax=Rotaria sordida TaxID=392033 RepID=A0A818UIE4_9BILA|nr:unnamed protein product [Rotaria sordida]
MLQIGIFLLATIYIFKFADASVQCEQKNVTIQWSTVVPNTPSTTHLIATWFCWKQGIYDHTYWSFSYQSSRYSYVDYVINHSNGNIVVLNVDRLGVGYTSGLIATGFLHVKNPDGATAFINSLYPVQLDPKFSHKSIPTGYLTTNPFNNTRNIDPNVISLDELLKQTGTTGEISTIGPASLSTVTQLIPNRIPVLVVIGQYNVIFYNPLAITLSYGEPTIIEQREQSSYSNIIKTYVLQRSGHHINLHLNAQEWYEQALIWTREHFL